MLQPPIGSFEEMIQRRKKTIGDNKMYIRNKFKVASLIAPSAPPVPLDGIDASSPLFVK